MTTTNGARRQQRQDERARHQLRGYLQALAGPAIPGSLFEIRARHGQLMRRRFIPIERPEQAVCAILRLARERDVYLGVVPRSQPRGGRTAIAVLSTLWVDADTPEAIARLAVFQPAPSIVISSGRGQHAYWLLDHAIDAELGEDFNRRLASYLNADESCADAARILRPPATTNYGYQPPRPVELLRIDPRRQALNTVAGALPGTPEPSLPDAEAGPRELSGDALLALDPACYVRELLGVAIPRDRKVSCPFHRDEHPSLHVYPTASQGWHCFSCRRGGSVYDLAALVWELEPRGHSFLVLRQRLRDRLLGGAP